MTHSLAVTQIIRPEVLALSAYPVPSAVGMVKLDAMENPYRLPEKLRDEVARAVANAPINRYPDPSAPELKAKLREVMQIPPGCEVLIGNGSDEIIQIATTAVARPDAVVLAPEPSFVMYRMNAVFAKCRYVDVPLRPDFSFDAEAFSDAMRAHRPALAWIAYPNNPTGNLFPEEEVGRVIAEAPGLVVVDEAYNVFAGKSFMHRLAEFPNLMVMRTVSKAGMAGVRLGYAVAHPEWIRELDKVRPPYNVSVLTQVVAETVLDHYDVLLAQAERIKAERGELLDKLHDLRGVKVFPSDANFVLVRVPDAPRAYEKMRAHRVLVKNFHGGHPLLDHCLRLTVGTPGENELMMSALTDAL